MTLPVGNIVNTLATGGTSTNVFIPVFMNRNPTTTDLGYQPTQRWINTVTFDEWILYNIPIINGLVTANWQNTSNPGGGYISFLLGNSGGEVGPNASGVVNVVGDGTTITAVGTPSSNTITLSVINTGVLETLTGDSGGAIAPVAGNITISGGLTNLTFVGTTGTLTLTGNVINSITGTTHEITASTSSGAVTLSIPTTFIAPGTAAAVTSLSAPIYLVTGSSSGTISILPQAAAGTFNFNLPITAGTSGFLLTSAGGGSSPMTWTNPASIAGITTIDGNSGSATPSAGVVTITTGTSNASGTAVFTGSGSTVTLSATDSNSNTGWGSAVLSSLTAGDSANCGFGYQSLKAVTSGSANTCMGYDSGFQLTSGGRNTLIGSIAGYNYTSSESNNIILGNNVPGTQGESYIMRLGNTTGDSNPGDINACYIQGIYNNNSSGFTTPLAVYIDSTTGQLGYGASGGVTSVTGTTNQILASPTTGAVILSLIGPYTPATYTTHGVLIGAGTSSIVALGAGTAGQLLQSGGASANPAYSTTTYPTTNAVNTLLYASSANVMAALAAANNGVLISGTGGIPSWLAAGTTGQVLVATTSNPASWGTLSSIAVTSITGTAHQITASASTGAVTLSMPTQVEINTSTLQTDASLALGANMYIAQGQIYAFRNDGANGNTYWMGFPSGSQDIAINVAADPSTLKGVGITTSSDGTIGGTITEGLRFIPLRGAVQYGTLGAAIQSYDSNASALADILAFYTNNAEHMRLTAGGALGINDIAPGTNALLSVVGGAQIGFSGGTASISNGLVISGNVGVGLNNPNSNVKIFVGGSVPTTNANTISIYVDQTLQTTGTGQYLCFASNPNTVASSFTSASIVHFNANQGTFGSGSTVTSQIAFQASSGISGAGANYGFGGSINASGTSNWNCYMSGSAPNYMNGGLTIASSSSLPPSNGLYVAGQVTLGGTLPSGSGSVLTLVSSGNNSPELSFYGGGGGSNQKVWSFTPVISGGYNTFYGYAYTDSYTSPVAWLTIPRTGTTIGTIGFGSTISTIPPNSSTVTGNFISSMTAGTSYQNTTGYDVLINISVVVTAATGATLTLGVGATTGPSQNAVVTTFSAAAATYFSFSAYVPNNYYVEYNSTGTITIGSATVQCMGV